MNYTYHHQTTNYTHQAPRDAVSKPLFLDGIFLHQKDRAASRLTSDATEWSQREPQLLEKERRKGNALWKWAPIGAKL